MRCFPGWATLPEDARPIVERCGVCGLSFTQQLFEFDVEFPYEFSGSLLGQARVFTRADNQFDPAAGNGHGNGDLTHLEHSGERTHSGWKPRVNL